MPFREAPNDEVYQSSLNAWEAEAAALNQIESLRKFSWLLAVIIIALAWYIHEITLYEKEVRWRVFGDYRSSSGIELSLKANQRYTLLKDRSLFLSGGKFSLKGDTIILTDQKRNKQILLLYLSDDELKTIDVDFLSLQENFLCLLKFYPDGGVKFTGAWKHGQKHGTWQYFDAYRNLTERIIYQNGKPVE
jgi:hypothetical protein